MERYFRFNDTAQANEVVLPLSVIRGFDVTSADTMVLWFDGLGGGGAPDGGGGFIITINSGDAKSILKTFANAASSGGEAIIDFIDENTGLKIHPSVVSFVEAAL